MTISTNKPGHRTTDLPDWGPTFQKTISAFFQHPYHLLPGIQLGASQIISRDKLLNGNWSYIFSSLTKFILTILEITNGTI